MPNFQEDKPPATPLETPKSDLHPRYRPRGREGILPRFILAAAILAFLPPFCLVALLLGAIGLRRSSGSAGRARSTIALTVGGFFTALYLVIAAGTAYAPPRASGVAAMEGVARDLCRSERKDAEQGCTSGYFNLVDEKVLAAEENLRDALKIDPELRGAKLLLGMAASARVIHPGQDKILFALVLLLAFVLHEYAHARAAHACGDDTAAHQGRLSLNPFVHLDPIGSILLPGFLLLKGGGLLVGWARPVPVNPSHFRNPGRDDVLVSAAGIATNAAIAAVCLFLLVTMGVLLRILAPSALTFHFLSLNSDAFIGGIGESWIAPLVIGTSFLKKCLLTNIGLAAFNLFPVPPLDGAHILHNLLPLRWRAAYEKTFAYGVFLLIALMVSGAAGVILIFPIVGVEFALFGLGWLLGLP